MNESSRLGGSNAMESVVSRRFGLAFYMLVVTIVSIIISLIVTVLVFFLIRKRVPSANLVVAIAAPALIVPPLAFFYGRLLRNVIQMKERMQVLANHDHLTGLMSRQAIFESARALLNLSKRNKTAFSVLYLDFDNFKLINDMHGHDCGDIALRESARAISQAKRMSDLAGRIGGEEFLLILPETDENGALVFAERIRQAVENNVMSCKDLTIRVTASIGLSTVHGGTDCTLDQLIGFADKALYSSKKDGRNRITTAPMQPAGEDRDSQRGARCSATRPGS